MGETETIGLMTAGEVCDYLGISRNTLHRLLVAGRMAYVRIGGQRRVPKSALDEFVARNTIKVKEAVA